MSDIKPPPNDEVITRHHFYAATAAAANSNAKDISGVGVKLTKFTEVFEVIRDDVKTTAIRNKTLITAAVVVWTLLGSGISLYVQRGLSTFDKASERIETMERKITAIESINDQRKDLPDKVGALSRKYEELLRKVDDREGPKK